MRLFALLENQNLNRVFSICGFFRFLKRVACIATVLRAAARRSEPQSLARSVHCERPALSSPSTDHVDEHEIPSDMEYPLCAESSFGRTEVSR